MPFAGVYLWQWYQDVSDSIARVVEGICRPIPPTEWEAWSRLTGNVVNQVEYDILVAMDREFCSETNKELRDLDARRQEAHKKELEEAAKTKNRGK